MELALFLLLWIWCIWCAANSLFCQLHSLGEPYPDFQMVGSTIDAAQPTAGWGGVVQIRKRLACFSSSFSFFFPSLCVLFFLLYFFLSKTIYWALCMIYVLCQNLGVKWWLRYLYSAFLELSDNEKIKLVNWQLQFNVIDFLLGSKWLCGVS